MSSIWLNSHRSNKTSAYGEDGILAAIFDRIGIANKWCCEFGAWDGIYASNTHNLIHANGWSAVLIEADRQKYGDLVHNVEHIDRVIPRLAFVTDSGPNSLDHLLAQTPIPRDFDLLSIDVDNDDYLIWRALQDYRPRVVVIEVQSAFPPNISWIPKKGFNGRPSKRGSSIRSMVELGKDKGYELAIHTGNCIFVQRELTDTLEIDADNWQELFDASWIGRKDETVAQSLRRVCGRPYRWLKHTVRSIR